MSLSSALRPLICVRPLRAMACALPLFFAACGGGGYEPPPTLGCSVADQKTWLREYMNDAYFWYRTAPNPEPQAGQSVAEYFDALLFNGDRDYPAPGTFPADRWSYSQSTEEFNSFFEDGEALGYGVSVAGIEVEDRPDLPLMVRYVAPRSPAAAAGMLRGDQVISLNGVPASELIADNDFSLLTPLAAGDSLRIELFDGASNRTVTLTAAVYGLTPVAGTTVVSTPGGRKLGYVFVNNMIDQAKSPLDDAFEQFRDEGVQDLVIDMRYNGGGLVSLASRLASQVAGDRADGETFAKLLYNDRLARDNNQTFDFEGPRNALGLNRVFVLAGPRTCSASELVVNGLRPFVDVVLIGDATCGKPVGFLPQDDGCDTTYSAVNFESVNARDEGRYFEGLNPTCSAADDVSRPIGALDDILLVTAAAYADNGVCPATGAVREQPLAAPKPKSKRRLEPGERHDMIPR